MTGHTDLGEQLPWSKFHWADYERDPDLLVCSFAAQGLWMRMLCFMARAERHGYLIHKGRALPIDRLLRVVGGTADEVMPLLHELEDQGVLARDAEGVIYSRRMVRDRERLERDRANGRTGGNPALLGRRRARAAHAAQEELDLTEKHDLQSVREALNKGVNPREDKNKNRIEDTSPGRERVDADVINLTGQVGDAVRQAVAAWNALAEREGLPVAQRLTTRRSRSIRARLADAGGLSGWNAALEKVAGSAFLKGGGANGWKITLDDLLTPDRFTRLMEGAYADRTPALKTARTLGNEEWRRQCLEGVA
ncbi:hypothetical protein F1645_16350 (plasmid) [Novacetimonas hansenii]|uniref:Uncharacterized protein n=1 Tax=Novacetimonas hansenii TaxID=436 RepID=A0ABQ0SG55_NOVHA|nr:hypothetical protein [Novacetimonas hansenii]GAN83780.1 hypothetical protein Gaha_0105_015 [Novacetimonas hansenii JCM 7643]GBQ63011.1 hypothetical protein AA0243_3015 [Novacetimonas hansenii NRIC 0243]GEC64185.1 hypothetical protein GHA01_20340 [Novacetimonas hansenii]